MEHPSWFHVLCNGCRQFVAFLRMTLTVDLVDLALDTADLILIETSKQHLDQLEAACVGYEQRLGNLK